MAILNSIGGVSTGGLTGILKGPLSKLFGSKGAGTLQYPADLGNDPTRMHIVQFQIKNIIPKHFDVKETISKALGAVDTTSAANTASNVAGGLKAGAVATKDFVNNIQKNLQPELSQTVATISLYMPDTLAMDYSAQYSELSIMDATNGYNRIAGAVGSLADDLMTGGMNGDNIKNSIANAVDQYGPEAAFTLADRTLGTNVTDLGLKAMGQAINPQLQLIYKGLGFRKFGMEFIFTPKSKDEADQVSAIVNSFIYAAHPTVTGTSGMYFTPPSIFEIKFMMAQTGNLSSIKNILTQAGNSLLPGLGSALTGGASGVENDRLYKVGKCVLENVSVDYAPNGWAALDGGVPLQTRLNLSFIEYEILDRGRMAKGDVR